MFMKIAAIQFNAVAGEISRNLAKIEGLVNDAAARVANLIVLPEICDIGYEMGQVVKLAEAFPNRTTDFLGELARKNNVIITAGLAEKKIDGIYNAAVTFDTSGNVAAAYHKTHLCRIPPFDEPKVFRSGSKIFVKEVEGLKLGFSICFDIRFPEVYRKLATEGAQIVLHPTAFPRSRIEQFEICARARTIENQFFFVSANLCSHSGGVEFGGCSMIVAPNGLVLKKASEIEEDIVIAEVDLSEVERQRRDVPVYSCRRPELY